MNLIGIMGQAGVGKDTAASALVEHRGFVRMSLADPMKRAVMEWFGWSVERLWGPSAARNEVDPMFGCSARKALQLLGTEMGRECYRNLWVDYTLREAARLMRSPELAYSPQRGVYTLGDTRCWEEADDRDARSSRGVVISDVRFRNELDAIKAAGGRVIRIVRSGAGLAGASGVHASEAEQIGILDDELDGVIVNDGTVMELHDKIIKAVGSAA